MTDLLPDNHELETPAAVLRVDEAVERMGNDREIYLEIAGYFAGNLPASLQALRAALDEGRLEDARRLAHSLKGNCATVGAEELREGCFALERLCRDKRAAEAGAFFARLAPQLETLRGKLLAL